jgi:hypothetical protein
MNSQATMYLAEARQTELRSTAARSRLVARTSTRSWAGRFRAAVVGWHRQPLAAATVPAPTAPRPSTAG